MRDFFRKRGAAAPDAADIDGRYETAIGYWSVDHGCVSYDYTGEQFDRLHALKAAGGDVRIAKCLTYGMWIYDLGIVNEWGEVMP